MPVAGGSTPKQHLHTGVPRWRHPQPLFVPVPPTPSEYVSVPSRPRALPLSSHDGLPPPSACSWPPRSLRPAGSTSSLPALDRHPQPGPSQRSIQCHQWQACSTRLAEASPVCSASRALATTRRPVRPASPSPSLNRRKATPQRLRPSRSPTRLPTRAPVAAAEVPVRVAAP